MNDKMKSIGALVMVAMIFGMSYVAQKSSTSGIGPFLFTGIRFFLAAATVGIPVLMSELKNKKDDRLAIKDENKKRFTVNAGVILGIILFLGFSIQQAGMFFTSASKTGFLTALYIVIVPILSVFLKQKIRWNSWISVAIAVVGLYLLCITDSLRLEIGDSLILISAVFWAVQILVLGHYSNKVDILKMNCIQFVVAAIPSTIVSFFFDRFFIEHIEWANFIDIAPELLYTGILSSGLSFTLQAIGQKNIQPTTASLLMSTEAVFTVIFSFLILGERLNMREGIGCILMFSAVIITQIPAKNKSAVNNCEAK